MPTRASTGGVPGEAWETPVSVESVAPLEFPSACGQAPAGEPEAAAWHKQTDRPGPGRGAGAGGALRAARHGLLRRLIAAPVTGWPPLHFNFPNLTYAPVVGLTQNYVEEEVLRNVSCPRQECQVHRLMAVLES